MRISIINCFSSDLSQKSEENNAGFIDIGDSPKYYGGQSEIYEINSIDGKTVKDLLFKNFKEYPSNIEELITVVRENKNKLKIDKCLALRALPLYLIKGTLNSKPFYGHVMRKVEGDSNIWEDDDKINEYINLPLEERIRYCLQFVEGMDILYRLTIVHADLNGQNIMIDLKNKRLAIIDLDGGAVARNGSTPVVVGKDEPGWLAPELKLQLLKNNNTKIDVNITADLWSIACGVHHLIFGLPPFFFIEKQHEIEVYLKDYKWPNLRKINKIKLINPDAFDYHERTFNSIKKLQKFLIVSFNEGYFNTRRISAAQWLIEIKETFTTVDKLELSNKKFDFLNKSINSKFSSSFIINNVGGGFLNGMIKVSTKKNNNWLKLPQTNISNQPKQVINFEINTNGLPAGFQDEGTIEIRSNMGIETVSVTLSVEKIIPSKLEISKQNFDFLNKSINSKLSNSFSITHNGVGVLNGTIKATTKSNMKWLIVPQTNINNQPKQNINFDVNTNGLPPGFKDTGIIEIMSNLGNKSISINLSLEDKTVDDKYDESNKVSAGTQPNVFYCNYDKIKTEHRINIINTSCGNKELIVECNKCDAVLRGENSNYRSMEYDSFVPCECADFETFHIVYITLKNQPACFCTKCGKTIIGESPCKKMLGWINCKICNKKSSVLKYMDEKNQKCYICSYCKYKQ